MCLVPGPRVRTALRAVERARRVSD
jgi:hypothetical protein